MYKYKVLDWQKLFSYVKNPKIYRGLFLDICVFPLALIMFILNLIRLHCKIEFEKMFHHDLSKKPILLIHGSGSSSIYWLLTRLLYFKRYNVYTIDFDMKPEHTIEQMSEHLKKEILSIHSIYQKHYVENIPKIRLVGQSLGGLVASYSVENYDLHKYIDLIVTIGSPFRGVPALEFIDFNIVRYVQMRSNSSFIEQYNSLPKKADYICFGSEYDHCISYEYTTLDVPNALNIKHNYGHLSPILFPFIWKELDKIDCILNLPVEKFLQYTTRQFVSSHDATHAQKVYDNAKLIYISLNPNPDILNAKILKYCSLLHDVLDYKYVKSGKTISREILYKYISFHLGKNVQTFFNVIDNISYSKQKKKGIPPFDKETMQYLTAVNDADKLEALGYIGLQRCFNFAKELYPKLNKQELNKKVVEHCNEKLLDLPNYLLSDFGKGLSLPLTTIIQDFVKKNT